MTIEQANSYFEALPDGFASTDQLRAALPASAQKVQLVGVAGTAGKTTVAALLAATLRAAGIHAGLYHAGCEPLSVRVRVDGAPVDEGLLCLAAEAQAAAEPLPQDAAELAAAAYAFGEAGCALAVVELPDAGLAEALPQMPVCAVTSVGPDGVSRSVERLAALAAGVMRKGSICVTAPEQPKAVLSELIVAAGKCDCELVVPDPEEPATETFQINSDKWWTPFWNGLNSNDKNNMSFIAVHAYQHYYDNADTALQYLHVIDEIYEAYKKPIWVTEFAVADSGNVFSPSNSKHVAQVQEFMKIVLKGLQERSYVERYSWFSFDTTDTRNGAAALWTNSTGELTELGQAYVDNGNPKTDYVAGNVTNTYSRQKAPVKQQPYSNQVRKPARVKIKSAKNLKGKKVKLTFKKVSKAVGYQIKASDSKKFKGYWTKNTKKTSYTFKKLDKNTRYYFKVRAYVKKGNSKLYGAWSKAKKVKVKK